ncbi:hypothetical protein [Silvanigrella aquatica]|uniref:hypothetical protein n=1 Tax=Silvanigrella aquatica TaxID=1915309 RepID=UPI000AB91154|nr:hypothetical protein [Silvanigrella aquatica]
MAYRETEIHYSIWLYSKKQNHTIYVVLISLLFHVIGFYTLKLIEIDITKSRSDIVPLKAQKDPIKFRFTDGQTGNSSPDTHKKKKKETDINIPQNNTGSVLTDNNPNSKSKTLIPDKFYSPDMEARKNPFVSKQLPQEKKKNAPVALPTHPKKTESSGMDAFLPHSSSSYIDKLRKDSHKQQQIEGDAGDIPFEGSDLTPYNKPRIQERYAVKDMSLYQFSQEFKNRFSGIWKSQERWVPPSSPLRPGDIVYYKLYIKGDGSLQKFENLSHKTQPEKDFSAVDNIVNEVFAKVFPMTVPARFAQILVTEIVAIQVVGANSPVQYSFQ